MEKFTIPQLKFIVKKYNLNSKIPLSFITKDKLIELIKEHFEIEYDEASNTVEITRIQTKQNILKEGKEWENKKEGGNRLYGLGKELLEHPLPNIKKFVRFYNLHNLIKGYSKMNKETLIDEILKHMKLDEETNKLIKLEYKPNQFEESYKIVERKKRAKKPTSEEIIEQYKSQIEKLLEYMKKYPERDSNRTVRTKAKTDKLKFKTKFSYYTNELEKLLKKKRVSEDEIKANIHYIKSELTKTLQKTPVEEPVEKPVEKPVNKELEEAREKYHMLVKEGVEAYRRNANKKHYTGEAMEKKIERQLKVVKKLEEEQSHDLNYEKFRKLKGILHHLIRDNEPMLKEKIRKYEGFLDRLYTNTNTATKEGIKNSIQYLEHTIDYINDLLNKKKPVEKPVEKPVKKLSGGRLKVNNKLLGGLKEFTPEELDIAEQIYDIENAREGILRPYERRERDIGIRDVARRIQGERIREREERRRERRREREERRRELREHHLGTVRTFFQQPIGNMVNGNTFTVRELNNPDILRDYIGRIHSSLDQNEDTPPPPVVRYRDGNIDETNFDRYLHDIIDQYIREPYHTPRAREIYRNYERALLIGQTPEEQEGLMRPVLPPPNSNFPPQTLQPLELQEPDDNGSSQGSDEDAPQPQQQQGNGKKVFRKKNISGGKIRVRDVKEFLNQSYKKNSDDKINDWILDKQLSTTRAKIYHNPKTGQTTITHTGTDSLSDWGNNLVYGLFGKKGYKHTNRFKDAEEVQKKALKKYGANNLSTLGHSQSGMIIEMLGQKGLNGREGITLNKATRIGSNQQQANQFDIRTTGDVVSNLNPFQRKIADKTITIKSKTSNPLTEHSPDVLNALDQDEYIGHGKDGSKWGLHAVVISKSIPLKDAKKISQDIIKDKKKKFMREETNTYRFRAEPKTKFKKFRTHNVNKDINLVYGEFKN
tara:strand:+ start:3063 stop:5876 length:2814 start_codon:yes stop_codon:yes gene_type:complete